jgi:hypothetical protein
MGLGCVEIDANQEVSGTLHGNIDSRPIAGGRRIGVPLARDRIDSHTTGRRKIISKNIGTRPPACLFDSQVPGP